LPNTNPTKTKQKIAQHEPHQNKAKECLTQNPPAIFCFVLVGFVLGNLLLCFGEVRVGQSFVLSWWGSC
jgi:hypothetical protein